MFVALLLGLTSIINDIQQQEIKILELVPLDAGTYDS